MCGFVHVHAFVRRVSNPAHMPNCTSRKRAHSARADMQWLFTLVLARAVCGMSVKRIEQHGVAAECSTNQSSGASLLSMISVALMFWKEGGREHLVKISLASRGDV